MVLPPHTAYTKSPSVVGETLNGEVVLLCLDQGVYYGLDGIGTQVWTSLTTGHSPQQTVAQLSSEFPNIAQAQLQSDVERLIDELTEAGLLVGLPST